MTFHPKLVPTVAVAFGVVICLSLSAWQVKRHQIRNEGGVRAIEVQNLPPIGAKELSGPRDQALWRRVEAPGRYIDDPVLVSGRSDRERAGYSLLEPFQVDGGPLLVVDRGWVPGDGLEAALAKTDTGDATVTLIGQLRPLRGDLRALPTESKLAGLVVWSKNAHMNYRDMTFGDKAFDGFVVAGLPLEPGRNGAYDAIPVDGYDPIPWDDTSRNYAIQWAAFAVILGVLWVRGSVGAATA